MALWPCDSRNCNEAASDLEIDAGLSKDDDINDMIEWGTGIAPTSDDIGWGVDMTASGTGDTRGLDNGTVIRSRTNIGDTGGFAGAVVSDGAAIIDKNQTEYPDAGFTGSSCLAFDSGSNSMLLDAESAERVSRI